ncbi:unnamed protein product [Blepharisma stoltei]|uniref:Uncharacterized protein n=1 Tax=Blepharisma stoltei TaxID=1481888 RepID=A0AAU9JGL6_9CILI|nr:unnamed protein product [Blepharisma stoltei]
MGNCECSPKAAKSKQSLNSSPILNEQSVHIPQMHPKVHALAEKVFKEQMSSVANIDLADKSLGEECGKYLAAILPYYSHASELNLDNCQLLEGSCEVIATSLIDMISLKELNLSRNRIGDKAADILSLSLSKLTKLEKLMLENIGIGTESVILISTSLLTLINLKELNLSQNRLGNQGARALANTFSYIPKLELLDIHNTEIGAKGAAFIGFEIYKLTKLKVLNIGENKLFSSGISAIISSLPKSIQILNFEQTGLDSHCLSESCEYLSRLSSLTDLYLDRNNISSEGSASIIRILSSLNLKYLGLLGCDVSQQRQEITLASMSTEIYL